MELDIRTILPALGVNVCSCFMCHAGAEAHRANRRARQRDRRQLGEALQAWRGCW